MIDLMIDWVSCSLNDLLITDTKTDLDWLPDNRQIVFNDFRRGNSLITDAGNKMAGTMTTGVIKGIKQTSKYLNRQTNDSKKQYESEKQKTRAAEILTATDHENQYQTHIDLLIREENNDLD